MGGAAGAVYAVVMVLLALSGLVGPGVLSSVRLGLLAVTSSGEGVVVPVEVVLRWPGTGVVEVSPLGLVGEDTLSSTIVAFYLAALLTGHEPLAFDGRIVFETREEVSGASGSGFLAAVFTMLFTGMSPPEGVSMTGAVSPLGLVMPVRGVGAKVLAAAREGYEVVLVPRGEEVNVSSGVRVVGVCSVIQAVSVLGGGGGVDHGLVLDKTVFEEAFMDDAVFFGRLVEEMGVGDEEFWSLFNKAMNSSDYYEAASLAFSRLVSSNVSVQGVLERLGYSDVSSVLRDALDLVEWLRGAIVRGDYVDLYGFLVLAGAEKRLYIAESMVSVGDNRTGVLRALTAISWARVYNETGRVGPLLEQSRLRHAVEVLVRYAEVSLRYAESIGGVVRMVDGRSASEWLSDARHSMFMGLYARAYAIALEVLSSIELTIFLHSMILDAGVDSVLECLEETSRSYMASLSMFPLLLSYPGALWDYVFKYTGDDASRVGLLASLLAMVFGLRAVLGLSGAVVVRTGSAGEAGWLAAIVFSGLAAGVMGYGLARLTRKEVEEASWPLLPP